MGTANSRLDLPYAASIGLSTKLSTKQIQIPLHTSLNVSLTPRFAWTERQGETVIHKLRVELVPLHSIVDVLDLERQQNSAGIKDIVLEPHSIKAKVELLEYLIGDKNTVGLFSRRKQSEVRDVLSWVGESDTVSAEDNRLIISGHLRRKDEQAIEKRDLTFDLIICPPDLIVPESADDWLVLGSLYVCDRAVQKEYKWRAAVSIPHRKKSV